MATEEAPSTSASALRKTAEADRVDVAQSVGKSENTCTEVCQSATCKGSHKANSSAFYKSNVFKPDSTNTNECHKENDKGKKGKDNPAEKAVEETDFQCNICFDKASNPVVSMCGHLFCWPCLNQWMQSRPNRKLCPVCRGGVDIEKVVPVYCHNSGQSEDPRRMEETDRPTGQREEPPVQPDFLDFGPDENVNMVLGIGAFPFAFFGASFNIAGPHLPVFFAEHNVPNIFLYVAFLFLIWIFFA